jgi:hypothetical protein
MGASNVIAAYTRWGPVLGRHHKSRVVLLVMASISLDRDETPRYWGGSDHLAQALGLKGSKRNRDSRVSEAIRVLVEAGAVTRIVEPSQGQRAVYRLNIKLGQSAEEDPPTDAPQSLVTSDGHSLVTGDNTPSLQDHDVTPNECAYENEGGEEQKKDLLPSLVSPVTSAPIARCSKCSQNLLSPTSIRSGLCGKHRDHSALGGVGIQHVGDTELLDQGDDSTAVDVRTEGVA